MFEGVCSHMFCRDRRPRRSESEGYVRTHLEREKRCRSLICSNISHVHGPPRTSVPTRLVRFLIIDYRRKSRCLTEDFRSATNMFAQIIFREWRSRQACAGFPANINLSVFHVLFYLIYLIHRQYLRWVAFGYLAVIQDSHTITDVDI